MVIMIGFKRICLFHFCVINSLEKDQILIETRKCVDILLNNSNYRKFTIDEPFTLHFDDSALEILNVLSSHEIKTIEAIEYCSKKASGFRFRPSHPTVNDFEGASNITYLNGIYPALCPDIHEKVLELSAKALLKEGWEVDVRKLGIKCVKYLSFNKHDPNLEERRLKSSETVQVDINAFVVRDKQVAINDKETATAHPNADVVVERYLHQFPGTVYTAMIMLTDRSKFVGGDVLVRKTINPIHNVQKDVTSSNEEYDDDDIDVWKQLEEDIDLDEANLLTLQENFEKKIFFEYDVMNSTIHRYTPEKGSVFIIDGRYDHGTQVILHGKRNVLWIEFWTFEDSPANTLDPLITDELLLYSK